MAKDKSISKRKTRRMVRGFQSLTNYTNREVREKRREKARREEVILSRLEECDDAC